MSENIRILSSRTMFTGRVFEVVQEEVLLSNGNTSLHATVKHNGAVVILPKLNDGRFVMIRQYRHSVGKAMLEFPAGSLEVGEVPEECAAREISEETGYGAKTWKPLGTLYPAPGFCNEIQHCFYATDLFEKKLQADDDEILEVEYMTQAGFEAAILSGEISDNKSIAIFTRARLAGLL